MPTMRRVLSEVSITDMLLANTMMPKSASKISLPEALAHALERLNCSESRLLNKQLRFTHGSQLLCDTLDDDNKKKLKRRSYTKRCSLSSESKTKDEPSGKPDIRQQRARRGDSTGATTITDDSRHSSRGALSKDTYYPNTSTRRCRKSRIIKKIDKSTMIARGEPIPKWITITDMDIHAHIPGRTASPKPLKDRHECAHQLPPKVEPSQFAVEHNLLPLSELAKLMCIELGEAVASGLFQPAKKIDGRETISFCFERESS